MSSKELISSAAAPTSDTNGPSEPSAQLLQLALLGLLTGCGNPGSDQHGGTGATGSITSRKEVADFDEEAFATQCAKQGNVIQTHPHCGGVNSCKGISYDNTIKVLTEHTCKGANTCSGVTCVELVKQGRRDGKTIFEATCAECHEREGQFVAFVNADQDAASVAARFMQSEPEAFLESVAFGVPRRDPTTTYPDMPASYENLSRAEMLGAIEFALALPLVTDDSGADPRR